MNQPRWWKTTFLLCVFGAATAVASPVNFKRFVKFDGPDGSAPQYVVLVQGLDGNFYGTTSVGGTNTAAFCAKISDYSCGTVFKITRAGSLTTLYSFCSKTSCTDGAFPNAGLVLGSDGNFYGTTFAGGGPTGTYGNGTVFKITPGGKLTTLHVFCGYIYPCTDNSSLPAAGLVQATDGNFYGTTLYGGRDGKGNIFKITPTGTLTTLYSFCSESKCTDGSNPFAGLVQGTDGNFYGTTSSGGANCQSDDDPGCGTVFKITAAGRLTTLYSFCSESKCTDGGYPVAGLVQGTDGNFYSTTVYGGHSCPTQYFLDGCGTVFRITPAGRLTTLYRFCSETSCTDGAFPNAGLVEGTDGNYYGTTSSGGANTSACSNTNSDGCGTVFKINAVGRLTTLHSFDDAEDGNPEAAPFQGTDGSFYGTSCGQNCDAIKCCRGTVFQLSVGLDPFVETLPTSGKVGTSVQILGTNLKDVSKVSFNGTAATFSQVSATEIKTSVPTGATTGFVTVTTSSSTLKSNKIFRVIPQITSFDPMSGSEGTVVTINGEGFKGATKVAFAGVKATSFKVDSHTQITATVPSGAKTGKITVITPGGIGASSGTFTVP